MVRPLHAGFIIMHAMSDRMQQLQKLYDVDATDPFITYAIAMEHIKTDQLDDAIRFFDETIALDASYAYAYYQKALALQKQDKVAASKQVLVTGLEQAQQAGDAKAVSELSELLAMTP